MKQKIGCIIILIIAYVGMGWAQDPNVPVSIDDDTTVVAIDSDTLEITTTTITRKSKTELLRRKASCQEQVTKWQTKLNEVNQLLDIFKE